MQRLDRFGFGLVEIAIAIGLVVGLILAVVQYSRNSRKQSLDFSKATSCESIVTSIVRELEARENSLIVRNWLPSASTPPAASAHQDDPYCKTSGATCDSQRMFNVTGGFVDRNSYKNFLNVRGGATWAQNIYNTHRGNGICTETGMSLSPAAFSALLPTPAVFPSWVTRVAFTIQDATVACGQVSNSLKSLLKIRIQLFHAQPGGQAGEKMCAAQFNSSYPQTHEAASIGTVSVLNGNSEPVPVGGCTFRQGISLVPGAGTQYRNVRVQTPISQPGALLLCRHDSAFAPPPNEFQNCPDFVVQGANVSVTPNTVSFNTPLQPTVQMSNMIDRNNDLYRFSFMAVNVGGIESPPAPVSFRVKLPACPIPTVQYCPNAVRANPASSVFQGIHVKPWDDCLNDECLPGTRPPVCDATIAAARCTNELFQDDCGLPRCAGLNPPSCASVNLNSVACGTFVLGSCGAVCGPGLDCGGPGPTPDPMATPTPTPDPMATPTPSPSPMPCLGSGEISNVAALCCSLSLRTVYEGTWIPGGDNAECCCQGNCTSQPQAVLSDCQSACYSYTVCD